MTIFRNRTTRKFGISGILLLGACFWLSGASTDDFLAHVQYLASDKLKGRSNGSPELDLAADYIGRYFEKYGLAPAGDGGSYFQEFQVNLGRGLGLENRILIEAEGRPITLAPAQDYIPLTYGPGTLVQGALVFAGFGISAPELNYDDYRSVDVRDKIVLMFEHEPQENLAESLFSGTELTPYSTALYKIANAKRLGAAAVILLPDSFQHSGEENGELGPFHQVEDLGIHAVRVSEKWGGWLLEQSSRDLAEMVRWFNIHLTPYAFDLGFSASIWMDVIRVRRSVRNVLGLARGQTDEFIVIGAHYDHLGLGDKTSLAPDLIGQIHNGADDNASGTAGLLQLAGEMGPTFPRRGLLFVAFAGEELGLLGSRYYTEHPTVPLKKTIAMINLDMIGRSGGDLLIGGVNTAREFRTILDDLQKASPLNFSYSDSFRGSSDHLSFALKRIPVLFFFSGLHGDYHRPSDDWEKIDLARSRQILEVVRNTVGGLQELGQRLRYVDVRRESHHSRWGGRGFGPRFGSLIDTSWELEGVRFAEILEGSPAARAGLKSGDVLVSFDGRQIRNLRDFTGALAGKAGSDEVEVVVLREGKLVEAVVRLENRDW